MARLLITREFNPSHSPKMMALRVHYPHCDALVVRAVMARNGLMRMLVDKESLVNIIYGASFNKMEVDNELTPVTSPLY